MLLLDIAAEQLNIVVNHFKRSVPQYTSKRKRISSVQNVKFRHRMPERMRGDSDAGNVRLTAIGMHFVLQGSCTDLFVVHVDEYGIRL